jgi:hypothetical protein
VANLLAGKLLVNCLLQMISVMHKSCMLLCMILHPSIHACGHLQQSL